MDKEGGRTAREVVANYSLNSSLAREPARLRREGWGEGEAVQGLGSQG
jgi:hypothetical protein